MNIGVENVIIWSSWASESLKLAYNYIIRPPPGFLRKRDTFINETTKPILSTELEAR
jgi:hypothetical protein